MKRDLFKEDLEIPVEEDQKTGGLKYLGYYGYTYSTMRKNFCFKDSIKFTKFSKGRSSVKAHFISLNTSNKYEMFLSDFESMLKNEIKDVNMINGIITAEFCFRKAGANYGLTILED